MTESILPKVTYYTDHSAKYGHDHLLSEIMEKIQNGHYLFCIDPLRKAQNEEERKKIKRFLPCFTGSGTFRERKREGLIAHNGRIVIDIDNVQNLDKVREILIKDPYTEYLFTSCSGNGLAIIVKIDGSRHYESFQYLKEYYKKEYCLIIDDACRDVTRLRYISYDPDLYCANGKVETVIIPEDFFHSMEAEKDNDLLDDKKRERIVTLIIQTKKLLGDDSYDSWMRIGFALAHTFGESGRAYFHELSKASPKYNFSECDKKYAECLRTHNGSVTFGTIIFYAKQAGIKVSYSKEGEGNKGMSEEKKKTQAEMLIDIASAYEQFHDDAKEGYAYVNNVAIKIRSSQFKQLLSKILWQTEGKAPNSDSLNQALNVIEAQAIHDGICIRLSNRVAEHESNFYYDLCDTRAVIITKDGWDVIDNFPILFKRYPHQQKQVEPKKSGDINKLFKFLNVKEAWDRLLCLVYLISCFVPYIPHPIFHPWGDQGAGKTFMFILFKLLIDPSKLTVMITQRDHKELVQNLEQHYLCPFDNLSSFPDWLSDLLSQACTGGGFSKRRLYTDDESVIFQIMRCIGINGINLLISRADLMDRTILLHLNRIEPSERKEWKVLMREFEEERPYILGCFFDVLSKAMAIHPTVKLSNLPRMADFMTWGVAITRALGCKDDDFINAYQANIEAQNSEIINSNTLAQAVLIFMQERESWSGTVKQAWEELEKLVTVTKDDNTFPKRPNKLRNHLNRIKPNLLDYGIKFTISDYDSSHRGCPLSFQKVPKGCSSSSPSSKTNTDKGTQDENTHENKAGCSSASSQSEASKDRHGGINEDNEHKKQTFWKSEDSNKSETEYLKEEVII